MLVTLIVIGALLAGGAVLVSVQMSSTRSMDLTRTSMTALYCAEAGVSAARPIVANNYLLWAGSFGTTVQPAWLLAGIDATSSRDLDGDGDIDYEVYIKDNGDEGTGTDDPDVDVDMQIFIISRCTMFPDTEKEVSELVLYNGATPCYPGQQGGCDGDGD